MTNLHISTFPPEVPIGQTSRIDAAAPYFWVIMSHSGCRKDAAPANVLEMLMLSANYHTSLNMYC